MTAGAATRDIRDGGADVGHHEQPGEEAGTLAPLLTHSVSHCQFMFHTLQKLQDGSLFRMQGTEGCDVDRYRKTVTRGR